MRERGACSLIWWGLCLNAVAPNFWSGVKIRTFLTENAQQHTHTRHTHILTHEARIGGCPYVVIMLKSPSRFSLSLESISRHIHHRQFAALKHLSQLVYCFPNIRRQVVSIRTLEWQFGIYRETVETT